MRGNLAWWPLFVDDFMGGTVAMDQAEIGCYILMLNAQWKSGEVCGIKIADTEREGVKLENSWKKTGKKLEKNDRGWRQKIQGISRGNVSPNVRAKFIIVKIGGSYYLRNLRLAEVYRAQRAGRQRQVDRGKLGAEARWQVDACAIAQTMAETMASQIPDRRDTKVSKIDSKKKVESISKRGREKGSKRKPETPIPDGFTITEGMRSWAAENTPGADLKLQTTKFINHAKSHDRRQADWQAAWRNWMLRWVEMNQSTREPPGPAPYKPDSSFEEHYPPHLFKGRKVDNDA